MHLAYTILLHAKSDTRCYAPSGINPFTLFPQLMMNDRNERFAAGKQDGSATYEIGIAGEIVSDWRDYLDATAITRTVDANQIPTTTLMCKVQDQAHLIGILNMLYEWGSVLIRIQRIGVV